MAGRQPAYACRVAAAQLLVRLYLHPCLDVMGCLDILEFGLAATMNLGPPSPKLMAALELLEDDMMRANHNGQGGNRNADASQARSVPRRPAGRPPTRHIGKKQGTPEGALLTRWESQKEDDQPFSRHGNGARCCSCPNADAGQGRIDTHADRVLQKPVETVWR